MVQGAVQVYSIWDSSFPIGTFGLFKGYIGSKTISLPNLFLRTLINLDGVHFSQIHFKVLIHFDKVELLELRCSAHG